MKLKLQKNSGQSMMEMIFSISILVTTVSAIIALNASNITSQKQSEYSIVANNLAREGIEVVRSIRDRNWLAGLDWDTNLKQAGRYLACFDDQSNSWSFLPLQAEQTGQLFLSDFGVYSCQSQGNLATVYYRQIEISHLCLNISDTSDRGTESIKESCDTSVEQKVGLEVRSIINWAERNKPHQVIIEDLIYDWK